MKPIIRPTRLLVTPAVVAVALLAACGGNDPGEGAGTAPDRADARARARLEAQAEQYERSAHLQGQARTYGTPAEHQDTVRPNSNEVRNQALAERLERRAHLEGQARTYSNADPSEEAPPNETSHKEFVPGSRHMPMR
jgi:hypothetical protein